MDQSRIYLSKPDVQVGEEERVLAAIRSGWLAPVGPELEEFELTLAKLANRKYAVAVSSGTAALHLGLLTLGVKPGDYVICSTLTFVATANAISYCGAVPVFVDSEPRTGNLSPRLLAEAIKAVAATGRRVSAVIPVDFLGAVASFEEILPICEAHQIPVLSDAAESLGAFRSGKPSGSFGHAAVLSFNGNKIVTTSGGGALLTDNLQQATAVRHLSTQAREDARHYEHAQLGFNYRLSNVLASIGNAQLRRLGEFVARRRENRRKYRDLFRDVPGVSVLGVSDDEDNCWLTSIVVNSADAGFSARDLGDFLETHNIESRPLWKPMHLQPLYRSCEAYVDGTAERLFRNGLALPSGSSLQDSEWDRISRAVKVFLCQDR